MNELSSIQLLGVFLNFIQGAAFMAALVLILLGTARIISLMLERRLKKQVGSIFLDKRVESATAYLAFGCLNRILTAVWLGVLSLFVMQRNLTVSTAIFVDVLGVAFVVVVPIGTATLVRSSLRCRRDQLERGSICEIRHPQEDRAANDSMKDEQEDSNALDPPSEECPICGEELEGSEDRCPLCFARLE